MVEAHAAHRIPSLALQRAGASADPLAAHHAAAAVVGGTAAVARAAHAVGAVFAAVDIAGERKAPHGTHHHAGHDVLALVRVAHVEPLAVQHGDVVAHHVAVAVPAAEAAVDHGAQVAAGVLHAAEVVEPHQARQPHRVLDELHVERGVIRVLDREGNLEFAGLELELAQGAVVDEGIDHAGCEQFELHAVAEFRRQVAREDQTHALHQEGGHVGAALVAQLGIARDTGQAFEHLVPARGGIDGRWRRQRFIGARSRSRLRGRKIGSGGFRSLLRGGGPQAQRRGESEEHSFHAFVRFGFRVQRKGIFIGFPAFSDAKKRISARNAPPNARFCRAERRVPERPGQRRPGRGAAARG